MGQRVGAECSSPKPQCPPIRKFPCPAKESRRGIPRGPIFCRGRILRCAAIPRGCGPVAACPVTAPSKSGQIKQRNKTMPLQDKTNPEDRGLTSAILDHLALHGAKPGPDETDHRGSVAKFSESRSCPSFRHNYAAARLCSMRATASVIAHGPKPKARSIMRFSPMGSRVRLKARPWPLRSARITSKPLIVA